MRQSRVTRKHQNVTLNQRLRTFSVSEVCGNWLARFADLNTSWSIGYDANGNRTAVTLNASTSSYTTAATSNRLTGISSPARSFSYDSAGSTTQDTSSAAPYTATYDLAGRLAKLTRAGVTTTYTYDNEGKRVRKASSSGAAATVVFVYDLDGHLIGEYDQNGVPIREYAWLQDTPIAVFTPDPANANNPPIVYFIETDHLGTPRVIIDKANNQRWSWMGEPFGTTAPNTNPQSLGTFAFNLRMPGQYADSESGLFYNYFRNYDSSTGRYTQPDPLGLDGGDIGLYSYVRGQPTRYTDPDGLQVRPMPGFPGIPGLPNPGVPSPRPIDPTEPSGPQYTPAPGWTWPKWLIPKNALDRCEEKCDDRYDDDQKLCEAWWKTNGRSAGYRICIARARSDHVQCIQDCKKDCEPK